MPKPGLADLVAAARGEAARAARLPLARSQVALAALALQETRVALEVAARLLPVVLGKLAARLAHPLVAQVEAARVAPRQRRETRVRRTVARAVRHRTAPLEGREVAPTELREVSALTARVVAADSETAARVPLLAVLAVRGSSVTQRMDPEAAAAAVEAIRAAETLAVSVGPALTAVAVVAAELPAAEAMVRAAMVALG